MLRLPSILTRRAPVRHLAIAACCSLGLAFTNVVGAAQVSLRWADNSSDESGFKVERANGSGAFAQIATTGRNVTRFDDTKVAAGTTYRYRVRAYNGAGNSPYSNIVTVKTKAASEPAGNTAPMITAIADQQITVGTSTGPLAFTISDAQTPAGQLTVTRNASNQTLIPLKNITLGGTGANRTVTIRPAAGRTGWSTIWIKVSDGNLSNFIGFVVNVSEPAGTKSPASSGGSGNTAPTISRIPDQDVALNGTSDAIAFTIGDGQTSASNLKVTANASDKSLIPVRNITLGGTGAKRTVKIRPVYNKTGWSTIWINVSDGSLKTVERFVVNVSAPLHFQDIGNPAIAGSHSYENGVFVVKAGGANIYDRHDEFHFGHVPLTGDAELTVKVESVSNTNPWTKAGLMFRGGLGDDPKYVGLYITPENGVNMQWRTEKGANAAGSTQFAARSPIWLRLLRTGNTFYGFYSHDGKAWEFVESVNVAMPATARAGLALTARDPKKLATAKFRCFAVD